MAESMTPSNDAILIGYFPKRVCKEVDWLKNAKVKEICSVSECISKGPNDWIDLWRHNEMWYFDSSELARSVLSSEDTPGYDLFAYRLVPIEFDGSVASEISIPSLAAVPIPSSFAFLGFDIVSKTSSCTFECSGLSCNHGAENETVNEYCLVELESEAVRLAKKFSDDSSGYEPGPYFVVEVWREAV